MHEHYDIDEILELGRAGMSASFIRDELGLGISVRQVQRLIRDRLGPRPTRQAIDKPDLLRSVVISGMLANGHDPYLCLKCGHYRSRPGLIHSPTRDPQLENLVFVCRHCSVPGDV